MPADRVGVGVKSRYYPACLTIVKRGSKGHHMIVPAENMPLTKYISLLESVAMFCEKQYMKRA